MSDDRPVLRIVRGEPTPDEVAALVVVLTAAGSAQPPAPPAAASGWGAPQRRVRDAVHPTGWWASALPR